MRAAKYIKIEASEHNISKQTIKHTPEGIRYLEVVDNSNSNIAFEKREFGKAILKLGSSGEIDTLIVSSISDLGKNGLNILETIQKLIELNINVKADKEKFETKNTDGSKNNSSITFVNMMTSIYQHEENIKIDKQRQGISSAKLKGTYKENGGNKPKLSYDEFINKEKNKNCLLKLQDGESIRKSAKLSGLSIGTVVKIKKLAEANGDLS